MFMQKIGYASHKINIPAISVFFIENIHLLLKNILTFIETTTLKKKEILIKTSFFQNKTILII